MLRAKVDDVVVLLLKLLDNLLFIGGRTRIGNDDLHPVGHGLSFQILQQAPHESSGVVSGDQS